MKNIKDQKGLTIIESLMATLVMGIFILGLAGLINFSSSQTSKVSRASMLEVDSLIAERVLFTDLQNVAASFNNIKAKDDNGDNFFDYIPDVGPTQIKGRKDRALTLSKDKQREFIFIGRDYTGGPPMIYDPTAAYQFDPPPSDMRFPGTFRFVSINKSNFVSLRQPALWTEGRVLMLDTPARVRTMQANGLVDLSQPPRSPFFIGQVKGDFLTPLVLSSFNLTHPQFPSITMSSADYFLRTVPPIGGATPVVKLVSVKIVRYYIELSKTNKAKVDVYRQIYSGSGFQNKQILASNVDKIVIKRNSIFQTLVTFNLDYGKEQKKGGSL